MRTAPSFNVLPWLIALAALLALPWLVTSDYYVNIASQIVIAAILALSLNLLIGFGGMISLGHAAYLGVAAYLSIYLTAHAGFGHLAGALIAIGATTVLAMLFGYLALRASGLGFLMITLALGQILWGVAYRWASLTGGDNGLGGLKRPHPFGLNLMDRCHFLLFRAGLSRHGAVVHRTLHPIGSRAKPARHARPAATDAGAGLQCVADPVAELCVRRVSGARSPACSMLTTTSSSVRRRCISRRRPKRC